MRDICINEGNFKYYMTFQVLYIGEKADWNSCFLFSSDLCSWMSRLFTVKAEKKPSDGNHYILLTS